MPSIASKLEQLVLAVHRRNGGQLEKLDFTARLLEPALRLDSLDLAEIMVGIEKELGVSPFESDTPPRTWAEVLVSVQTSASTTKTRSATDHRTTDARHQKSGS